MTFLLIFIHICICIALIMIVLLQTGKGADMGAAFGGGSSQTLFGSTGASTFLSKATTVVAVAFMVTSLWLALLSGKPRTDSVMQNLPESPAVGQSATETSIPDAAAPNPAADTATAPAENESAAGPASADTAEPPANGDGQTQ